MLTVVTCPAQVYENIIKFETEVAGDAELQARLAYARAWYALKDPSGKWKFGPSKFVGYQDVTAKTYLNEAEEIDGRRTEAQLQLYFGTVDPSTQLHQELSSALSAFLGRFGKTPSTKVRINITRARRLLANRDDAEANVQDTVVDLMVAISKTLADAQFQRLRSQLEKVWAA